MERTPWLDGSGKQWATLLREMPDFRPRPGWWHAAACAGLDVDDFVPATDRSGKGHPPPGIRLCHGCPVRRLCLAEALAVPGTVGVWGGFHFTQDTSVADRLALLRRATEADEPVPSDARRG